MNSFQPSSARSRVILVLLYLYLGMLPRHAAAAESPASSSSPAPLRLAIGGLTALNDSKELQEQNAIFTDLLTARLSQTARFQLVERPAIDAVTREISLSLSQTLKPTDAIRVGSLLRADWLLLGSLLKNDDTNTAIVKIVDARTGIIRDLTTISLNRTNLEAAAASVADFVSNSANRVSRTEQRVFLGIGGFEDLSINDRYPDFRKNLRASLEQKYRGTRYALVERAMINPLVTELRLNLSGLTGSALPDTAAQPAFLLVDGTYQSYQDETAKISLVLRVQEIGGGQKLYSFKEPPGGELDEKIATIISGALRDLRANNSRQTRQAEVLTQMNRGMERARISSKADPDHNYFFLGGYALMGSDQDKRQKNIAEAIEAFEAVLLLDPDNAEAKTYLAICLLDPAIAKKDAGWDYLREVIAGATNETTVKTARYQLAQSFVRESGQQGMNMLLSLARAETNAYERSKLLESAVRRMIFEYRRGQSIEQVIQYADQYIVAYCDAFKSTNYFFHPLRAPQNMHPWFELYQTIYRENRTAAEAHLDKFIPQVVGEYPNLAPYIWPSYMLWRSTNSAAMTANVLEKARASLVYALDYPERLPQITSFHSSHVRALMEWSLSQGEYQSAEILADIFKQVIVKTAANNRPVSESVRQTTMSPSMYYYAGYAYRGRGQWQAALTAFELARTKADSEIMMPSGPWGEKRTRVFAGDLINECRGHLSIPLQTNATGAAAKVAPQAPVQPPPTTPAKPASQAPVKFALGDPVLTLGQPTVFACDGDLVWLTDGFAPFCYDLRDQSLTDLDWPTNIGHNVTCIIVDKTTVWWGTMGSGLVEMDKQTRRCRVYTEKDGLLLPQIKTLALTRDKLWIGFGRKYVGGIGYLNLSTRRFTGLTPELDQKTITNRSIVGLASSTEAPRGSVLGLSPAANGDLLVLTENRGMQRYSGQTQKWGALSTFKTGGLRQVWRSPLSEEWCMTANSEMLLVGGNGNKGGLIFFELPQGPLVEPDFSDWLSPSVNTQGSRGRVIRLFFVHSLAFDGDRVWVGGEDFLAAVNLKTKAMEQLCTLEPGWQRKIKGLQVQGDNVWFSIKNSLYRLSKSSIK